jgi:geranylgeranyl diphosphate synthase, type I
MKTYTEFYIWFSHCYREKLNELIITTSAIANTETISLLLVHTKKLAEGGKFIRPFIIWKTYTAFRGEDDISTVLIATELLHLFALVHDDVIDQGKVRHNIETLHEFASSVYVDTQTGTSQAILIGDLLLSWSFTLITQYSLSNNNQSILQNYTAMLTEMIIGQTIDVHMSTSDTTTLSEVLRKNTLKSGNYTFTHPLVIGGKLANVDTEKLAFLMDLGQILGEVFQAQDDMLDISLSSNKTFCSDVEEGQHTILSAYIHEYATQEIKQKFNSFRNRILTQEEKAEVIHIIERSGAKEYIENFCAERITKAKKLNEEYGNEALEEVILLVEKRVK